MKKVTNWKIRYASVLLIATVMVSAPRYMGVFGQIVNVDLTQTWRPFLLIEIWSGLAMGCLEALILDYILQQLQKIKMWTIYWWVSLVFSAIILITFPFVTAPYMMAVMNGVAIRDVLNGSFRASIIFWMWTFLVASLIPLIVASIGIVRSSETRAGEGDKNMSYTKSGEVTRNQPYAHLVRLAQAAGILNDWEQANGKQTPTVAWLIEEFHRVVGEALPPREADEAIVEWRRRNGIAGRRPKEAGGGEGLETEIREENEISLNGKVKNETI